MDLLLESFMEPEIIGNRYKIIELIAHGMMGPVYRGLDLETDQKVAVKTLNPKLLRDQPDLVERFRREDEGLRQLNHPNIVHRLAAIEEKSGYYIIMEYVEGGSLRNLLDESGPITLPRVLEIALDLADALTRTHRMGIIHRDIKPENVLIAADGTPRLSDFGLAHYKNRQSLLDAGGIVGTWVYLPPETFKGLEVDERADIWSFGVLLFEMLSGRLPYDNNTPDELINALMSEPIPELQILRPDLPNELCKLVHAMLIKDRNARIPSIRLVGAAIEAISRGDQDSLTIERLVPVRRGPGDRLPAPLTSFVGREQELNEIAGLFLERNERLVTLTGPAGVGKTRLALQAARKLFEYYPDGVFFVDLAPISAPEQLVNRIGQAFGIKESLSRALLEDLKDHIRNLRCFALLDNFEHVMDAAPIVTELIADARYLQVLVTSREALRVYGEIEYPVRPLALPNPEAIDSLEQLYENESVALFTQRAQASSPEFQLSDGNARYVAEICVRLDGLPLAVELAAARVRLFSPRYLLDLLNEPLGALTDGPRDSVERHKTLRAAIDWSYELLNAEEKTFFARLAVFQGGRNLDAIEHVCSAGLEMGTLALVGSLVHKSLLHQQEGMANEPRFIFLETIHQYARMRLDQSPEKNSIQVRHADYFLELAKRASSELRGANQEFWSRKLRQEYDNLLVALEWSLSGDAPQKGLWLAAALSEFWYYEGPITDGDKWIDRALLWLNQERHPKVIIPPDLRSLIYNSAGMMDFVRGNLAQGREWNQKALRIAEENNDKLNQAWALFWLSANSTDEPRQYQEGIEYCERALTLFSESGENYGLAWGYNQLGEMTRLVGDYGRARIAYENSLQICRQIGNRSREAIALLNLTYVAQHQHDYAQAKFYILQGLRLLQELNLKYHSAIALSMLAGPSLALGDPERAVRLLGASQAIFERMFTRLQPADQVEINAYLSTAREQLTQSAFDRAWAQGFGMSYEQAISFAMEDKQEDTYGRS